MKTINLTKILAKYKSGWIALSADNRKFIASGNTLKEALEKAKKVGVKNPSVFKAVSPQEQLYIG